MVQTLAYKLRVARKDHDCMASPWINQDLRNSTFTFSEWRAIIKARNNGWKILKGQTYSWASCIYDGRLYSWKAIPEMEDICHKYDYFADL